MFVVYINGCILHPSNNQKHLDMVNLENVTSELENIGIRTTGCYSELPKLTMRLVINILHFGTSAIDNSNLGVRIKRLAVELAKKDGRTPSICPETLKITLS